MIYQLYEYSRALLAPAESMAAMGARLFSDPASWLTMLPGAPRMAAGYELLYRISKAYEKPEFGIHEVQAHGHRDQAWLAPTALTQPRRTLTLNNHELDLVGATFAPFERWQLTVAGTVYPPGYGLAAMTKVRALDVGRYHVAFLAGAGKLAEGTFLHGGAVASACLDAACGTVVSLFGITGPHERTLPESGGARYGALLLAHGASAIVPVARRFKVVAEIDVVGHERCGTCRSNAIETLVGFVGARVHGAGFSLTLGAAIGARSYAGDQRVWTTASVLPAGSLAYRFGAR